MSDKVRERNDLILEFGLILQPIVEIANASSEPTAHEIRLACAKVKAGDSGWRQTVKTLVTFAPDIVLVKEQYELSHLIEHFLGPFDADGLRAASEAGSADIRQVCQERISSIKNDFYRSLDKVPDEWTSEIFEANTPFTSYLKVKDAALSAQTKLYYFDRYLKPQFFEMYLRDIDRSTEVRIVTTASGVGAVLSISDLVRREFSNYQLLKAHPDNMHDRNLVVDNNVFSLGPGLDRAGFAPTSFGVMDESAAALTALESIISFAEVVHESKQEVDK